MAKILIVEDSVDLCSSILEWLSHEQHTVDVVHDGNDGYFRLQNYQFDVVVLDWDLPGMAGVEICRKYRSSSGSTPILMLTGKSEITNRMEGLDAGADDYLVKPFDLRELSARIRALLRRPAATLSNVLSVRDYSLDMSTKKLMRNGEEIILAPRELALMEFFMRHPDQVFSQEDLLEKVWSSESEASVYSVYTAVKMLRKKLTRQGEKSIVATVHGLGYRLESK